jgi:hypothetical protein
VKRHVVEQITQVASAPAKPQYGIPSEEWSTAQKNLPKKARKDTVVVSQQNSSSLPRQEIQAEWEEVCRKNQSGLNNQGQ